MVSIVEQNVDKFGHRLAGWFIWIVIYFQCHILKSKYHFFTNTHQYFLLQFTISATWAEIAKYNTKYGWL